MLLKSKNSALKCPSSNLPTSFYHGKTLIRHLALFVCFFANFGQFCVKMSINKTKHEVVFRFYFQ